MVTYQNTLYELASADPRIVVLTTESPAAIRATRQRFCSRFIDVGICEQTIIGVAAGLALRGRIPVVHAAAAFLTTRAFEFIRTDVGIACLPVKLIGAMAGFLSEANGPTHQAVEDLALMRGIHGMQVICPADEIELAMALPAVIDSPLPCYVRHTSAAAKVNHTQPFEFGHAERLRDGDDVAILTYGLLVGEAMEAAHMLASAGIETRVVNLRTLVPFDVAEVEDARRRSRLVVTLEDHFQVGGLYSILAEHLLRHGETSRVLPMALEGRWFRPALLPDVLELENLAAAWIATRIQHALGRTPASGHHRSQSFEGAAFV